MSRRFVFAGVAIVVALPLGILLLLSPSNPAGSCGGAGVPVTAGQLTSGQQQFAGELAARTGLDGDVIAAWELAEESGAHATARAAANNNDWLNIGYTDSGTYGSADSVWSDPVTAADATAGWLHGQDTIPGYGTATTAIQAMLTTAGQPAAVQIAAIQDSGWASSGYPDLPGLYASVATGPGGSSGTGRGAVLVSDQVGGIDETTATSYIAGLGAGVKVGYAVVSAGGQVLAQHDATMRVPGASITKAMLLVAYLERLGNRPVPPAAQAELDSMIEISDNAAGSWTFAQVGAAAVERVAAQAGMTGFALDTSDPVYTLGQSLITALDFARLFSSIDQLMPAKNRAYGMGLLENISAGDHWGILDAGIGATASKAGWKTEPDGQVVNQAAQLQLQGQATGIAIVSEGEGSQGAGEQIMQTVASDLLAGTGDTTAASGVLVSDQIGCGQPSGTFVSGGVASILPDGQATIPQGAPQQVQEAIAAGNALISTFYSQERRANMLTQVQDSYDCSGSTDFVLYNAGLSSPQVDVGDGTASDSTALETYDQTGPGQWITVYANPGHAFIEIAGLVLDTYHVSSVTPASVPDSYPADDPDNGGPASGPRWQPASIIPAQVRGDVYGWFDERHPAGL